MDAGIEVVLSDVANNWTLPIYRRRLPGLVVVQLDVGFDEAERRATGRQEHLTPTEFADVYRQVAGRRLPVDRVLDVTTMTVDEQSKAVLDVWTGFA